MQTQPRFHLCWNTRGEMSCPSNGACFSEDYRFRFALWREWSSLTHDQQPLKLGWIMLNPSIANASFDDPTISRCLGFARREGYSGIHVCNLIPLVATDPKDADIRKHELEELRAGVVTENDEHIRSMIDNCEKIVCAWGANVEPLGLSWAVERAFDLIGSARPMYVLGRTKNGHPRHPLYLRSNTPLEIAS